MLGLLKQYFAGKLILDVVEQIGAKRVSAAVLSRIQAQRLDHKFVERSLEEFVKECGFKRCRVDAVPAPPTLSGTTAELVMLPPVYQGGQMVCKIYAPTQGTILTFYNTDTKTSTNTNIKPVT